MKSLILIFLLTLATPGATYHGKNIDGKKFAASVKTGKEILTGSVEFDGKFAYFRSGKEIIELKLSSEVIDDPHDIETMKGWTIDILDSLASMGE